MKAVRFIALFLFACASVQPAHAQDGYRAELVTTRGVVSNIADIDNHAYFVSGPSMAIFQNNKADTATINITPGVSVRSELFNAGAQMYFLGQDGSGFNFFKTNLPAPGAAPILPFGLHGNYIGSNIIEKDGGYFFTADRYDSVHHVSNIGLYRSNGSAGDYTLIKLIQSYPFYDSLPVLVISDYISRLYKLNNRIYFFAPSDSNDYVLWVSDGTTAGTRVLIDKSFLTFPDFNTPRFIEYGDKVFFKYLDTVNNFEYQLWQTDGTDSGTHLFRSFFSGGLGCHDIMLRKCGGNLYIFTKRFITATTLPHGDLWVSDGTFSGTSLLKSYSDIYDDGIDSLPGNLYFINASVSTTDTSLHQCNCLTNEVTDAATILPGILPSMKIHALGAYDGHLFYGNRALGPSVCDLYGTDGLAAGTAEVDSPATSAFHAFNGINPTFYHSGSEVYFTGRYVSATKMSLFRLARKYPLGTEPQSVGSGNGIYPNPFSDHLNVHYTVSGQGTTTISVADITGREVMRMDAGSQFPGSYTASLPMPRHLAPGTYVVRIMCGQHTTWLQATKL